MIQRPSPRHAAAALLATLVVATTAGCGFSLTPQAADASSSAAPPSIPSTPPPSKAAPSPTDPEATAPATPSAPPRTTAPAPGTPSPATTGTAGDGTQGVDCAGNPATRTSYIDAVSATVDASGGGGPSDGVDVTGHPATLVCGGPDDLAYDVDPAQTTVFLLQTGTRVAVLDDDATTTPLPLDKLAQWLVQHPSGNSWAMVGLPGAPATFTEQYHP